MEIDKSKWWRMKKDFLDKVILYTALVNTMITSIIFYFMDKLISTAIGAIWYTIAFYLIY